MIICPNCGFRCGDTDASCPNCGYYFDQRPDDSRYDYSGTVAGRIWSVETSQLLATVLTIAFIVGAFWLINLLTGISPEDMITSIGETILSYYGSL